MVCLLERKSGAGLTANISRFRTLLHVDEKKFKNTSATAPSFTDFTSWKFDHPLTDATRRLERLLNQPPPTGGGMVFTAGSARRREIEA